MKYAHILKGSYIRPDILFGSYSESYTNDTYTSYPPYSYQASVNDRITYGSIQLAIGKQFIFDNSFLVDYYVGLGYTFTNHSVSDNKNGVPFFGVAGGNSSSPFSVSGGLRIGFLFK